MWVNPTEGNASRVLQALAAFGAPLFDLTADDLTRPDAVFQIGLPPSRIDVLTGVSGLTFAEAWPNRLEIRIGDLTVPVLGRADFVVNKTAAGRDKDLSDLTLLPPER